MIVDQEFRNLMKEFNERDIKLQKQHEIFQNDLQELKAQVSGIGQNNGAMAEELYITSLESYPVIGDIQFDKVLSNYTMSVKGGREEFDVVLVNGTSFAIVEIKYKLHPSDINKMVEKKIPNARKLFPEYEALDFYAGVAALVVPKTVRELAHEHGLFVLSRQGEQVKQDTIAMRSF